MRHSEACFQGFYPLPTVCYNSSTRFPELVRPLFPTRLFDFLCCPCDLSMEYFDTLPRITNPWKLFKPNKANRLLSFW